MAGVTRCGDDAFGPAVSLADCRGGFDFTWLFEEIFFTLTPSAFLIVLGSVRIASLVGREYVVAKGVLYWLKLITLIGYGCLQLCLLILFCASTVPRTNATIATAVLGFMDAIWLVILSHSEHRRSISPSTQINAYLWFTLLFDAVRARTLWLSNLHHGIAVVYLVALLVKLCSAILEAQQKKAEFVDGKVYPPQNTSGIINRLLFWWLNPLFLKGFRTHLRLSHLPLIDRRLNSGLLTRQLRNTWERCDKKGTHALAAATGKAYWWTILQAIIARLILIGFNYAQPFLITRTIEYVLTESRDRNNGYGLIGAFALVYIGKAILMAAFEHSKYRLVIKFRGGLVSLIYQKTLALQPEEYNDGAAVTVMSTDIDRIMDGSQEMHDIWACPFETALGLYLLYRQVHIAFLSALAIALAAALGTAGLAKTLPKYQVVWVKAVQKRVGLVSKMLESMKVAKMLGLSENIVGTVQAARVQELRMQRHFRYVQVFMNVIGNTLPVVGPFLTLAVATGDALRRHRQPLTVAQTFTAVSIIYLVAEPLGRVVFAVPNFLGMISIFARVQEFLNAEDRQDCRLVRLGHTKVPDPSDSLLHDGKHDEKTGAVASKTSTTSDKSPDMVFSVEKASFKYKKDGPVLLHDLDFQINKGSLTMIMGPVGSGKSMLLRALLGEMNCTSGSIMSSPSDIGYCGQTAWIPNGGLRDIIIGMTDYDDHWYQTVISACAIDKDVVKWPRGHDTILGSNGIALSGGQKQRVALARAVYARKEILILDDIFSGFDSSTAESIFKGLFAPDGLLRNLGVTAILATHAVHLMHAADRVIALGADGRILETKAPHLISQGEHIFSSAKESPQRDATGDGTDGDVYSSKGAHVRQIESSKEEDEDSRRYGDSTIYVNYTRRAGAWWFLTYTVLMAFQMLSFQFPHIWINRWAEQNAVRPFSQLGLYISVYAASVGIWCFCDALSMWVMLGEIVPNASLSFHDVLVNVVKHVPLRFLVSTDHGSLLNRFSQDMTLIDGPIAGAMILTFLSITNCIGAAVLLVIGAHYMAAALPPVVFVLFWIQKFYLRTSRQLRLLELEAKAPLYTKFTETINGLATIRAFGWDQDLIKRNQVVLDVSQQPYYLLFCTQRWLQLVLDLLVAAIATILMTIAVVGNSQLGPLGVALITLITLSENMARFVTSWTQLETCMGAVSRTMSFEQDSEDENLPGETLDLPEAWPEQGSIEIKNLSAAYEAEAGYILKSIDLTIPAGQRLGICGRSGSGKSSLLLCILRMMEIARGWICIDGIDLATAPRDDMRSRIALVPQDPVLFKATVRQNLSFFQELPDETILAALDKVGLQALIQERGGLDADMEDIPLSHGQRQLVCLARALLRKSKIVILDEATSSLDKETDQMMQRAIRQEFGSATVIAVAHRLESIRDFDRVAVLDGGEIKELDNPDTLLAREDSLFRALWNHQQ